MLWFFGKLTAFGDHVRMLTVGLTGCAVAFASPALCQDNVPQFSAYQVEVDNKKIANDPDFKQTNFPIDKEIIPHLLDIKKQYKRSINPNFSGHYILTTFSCGHECIAAAAVNTRTGFVVFFPGIENYRSAPFYRDPIAYCRNSSLIVFRSIQDRRFYITANYDKVEDDKVTLLDGRGLSPPKKADDPGPDLTWMKKYKSDPSLCDPGMAPTK